MMGEGYRGRPPQDHEARLQALDPSCSFLIQAPAGSGKTELLTDRILALLPTVRRPEEIVAITFTRKAASEMHARVLSKLQAGLGPAPQNEPARRSWELAQKALAHDAERGWNLLRHPARLTIRTIDAFCASLVRGMPWLSALGGMPDIVDDASAHYEAAARATLDLAGEYEAVSRLLSHLDVDLQAATQALASMLRYRDQWLPLLRHGTDRQALQEALTEAICEDLRRVVAVMPAGWHESLCGPVRQAVAVLDELGGEHALAPLRDWNEALLPEAAYLDRWKAVAHLLLTKEGSLRSAKGVNKNLGFPSGCDHKEVFTQWLLAADPAAQWITYLAGLRDVAPARFTEAQWEVLRAQLLTLTLAQAQLRLRFAATGKVDFIEISQRAVAALGSVDEPEELLLKLDASILHLLIDEFQDTSQTQLDLLATLTAGWQQDDGRTLFLVGDPMQSIYRFRKAEVGLFLQVRDFGLGELRPIFLRLKDNFRSQAGIVEWINRQFSELLPRCDDAAAGAIAYSDSNAFHPAIDGPAVTFHAAWGSDGIASADVQAEDLTVALVRAALAQSQKGRKHSVAILGRARSHLGRLVRRLTQEGIRCRAVDLVPLARRNVVSDLVQLVRALVHPADRLAWLCVLRAPWCGLTLAALQALFAQDLLTPIPVLLARALSPPEPGSGAPSGLCQAETVLSREEYERLRCVAAVLLDRSNDTGALPFAAWIESLWRRLGGAALYPSVSAASDAESLFLLMEQLAPYGGIDLTQLNAGVARLFASSDEAEGAEEGVEVMTMHKSKGLQFDTVILYGLHQPSRNDSVPLVRFEQSGGRVLLGPIKARADKEADPLSHYLAVREQRRATFEVDRLLYVAATRARHRLHLVGNVVVDPTTGEARSPVAGSLLSRLWNGLPECEKKPPAHGSCVADVSVSANAMVRGKPLRRISLKGLAKLAAAQERADRPPDAMLARSPWQASTPWRPEEGYDAVMGTVTHAWLAHIGHNGPSKWAASQLQASLPIIAKQLTRAGVPTRHVAEAAQTVVETLLATLQDERGAWLLSQANARREWSLIDAAGKLSVVDFALSTQEGWLIVDYKIGRPHPNEQVEAFIDRMRHQYGEQLRRYCAQVSALDGRPAKAALYFPRAAVWVAL